MQKGRPLRDGPLRFLPSPLAGEKRDFGAERVSRSGEGVPLSNFG